ncbi:MAG TPA: PKD domain-containing protein, partial [Mycobacteriales bacterium]|nr:PKD domain-containing protein [Mycobacteriales bacterium]
LSSLKAHAKHRYAKRGRYTTVLTVTDTSGLRAHSAATVLVAADGSTTLVPTPTTAVLAFDDDQSSDVRVTSDSTTVDAYDSLAADGTTLTNATLDYGDGTIVQLDGDPSTWEDFHTYTPGDYQATLTVVASDGSTSSTTTAVHAFDPPTLALAGPVLPVPAGQPVTLGVTAALAPGTTWLDWTAEYGDGIDGDPNEGAPPTTLQHTYDTPGQYIVTIAVQTDSYGTASSSYLITVV